MHSGPESTRHEFDARPSERDLEQTYLPAFRASIMEGKADSVMCAYNSVDGVPACANTDLLEKRLRGDWGFQGYVVSDCGAIGDIFRGHNYKPNAAEASATAVKAGTDLTCGNEYRALVEAVQQGLITEAEIDRSLERLFVARFRLGMFDPPDRVPFSKIPYSDNDSTAHRQLALEAARKSIVLLKNENQALPLTASVQQDCGDRPFGGRRRSAARQLQRLLQEAGSAARRHRAPVRGEGRGALCARGDLHLAIAFGDSRLAPSRRPAGSGHGLLAEYFDNPEFQGQPKVARVEPRPYLQAGMTEPRPCAAYSVRWSGTLRAPVTGEYTISTRGGFGRPAIHLYLDDQEVTAANASASRWKPGKAYSPAGSIHAAPRAAPGGNVQVAWIPPAEPLLAEAVEAVKNADVTLAFVGLNPNLEGEEMRVNIPGFAGGDRTDLKLPAAQEQLLEAAIADRQAADRGADQRQRAGRQLCRGTRRGCARIVVRRRRGGHRHRRDAGRRRTTPPDVSR